MSVICYEHKNFSHDKLKMIEYAASVLESYRQQGLDCTLRQLYYQFVQANLLKNVTKSYDWLGSLIADARMAGLIDWNLIVDRTRNVQALSHWQRPSQIIDSAQASYRIDRWANQPKYVEVWVEKDALRGVIAQACTALDVAHFSCRGYTSASEAWAAAQRLLVEADKGKQLHIIHLGDHDPSGLDMTRDIRDRLNQFTLHHNLDAEVHVERIALNMDQVDQYNLAPNPAKVTDSRFRFYQEEYGDESWELDALNPAQLVDLINTGVSQHRDMKLWKEQEDLEVRGKATLRYVAQYWPDVVKFLRDRRKIDDSPVVCTRCLATQNNPRCLCSDSTEPRIQLGSGDEY
jgi:hypothetical protein